MKTNIETNMNSDIDTTAAANARRGKGAKALVVILSLTALCLVYRAASEAVALAGVLEKLQATLASEQIALAQCTAGTPEISETKHSVAGL